MKLIPVLLIALMFLNYGCQKSSSSVEPIKTDEHPTRITSFVTDGVPFSGNNAVAIVTPGDTTLTVVTAVDEDKLISYEMDFNGQNEGGEILLKPSDTLTARFGVIAIPSLYKVGDILTQDAIFKDSLGFTTKVSVQIYITAKH
jgi:hypothetical protein